MRRLLPGAVGYFRAGLLVAQTKPITWSFTPLTAARAFGCWSRFREFGLEQLLERGDDARAQTAPLRLLFVADRVDPSARGNGTSIRTGLSSTPWGEWMRSSTTCGPPTWRWADEERGDFVGALQLITNCATVLGRPAPLSEVKFFRHRVASPRSTGYPAGRMARRRGKRGRHAGGMASEDAGKRDLRTDAC